ncbi:MAG: DUF423 domain-containing protein [Pseudomonadales bacterium]|nr:DUF423 domain-containing protein [Pseudomonadales bacterium]
MYLTWLFWAAVNGFIAVALGAFGAHGLQGRVTAQRLDNWHTAVQYQMFHAVALLAVAFLVRELGALPLLRVSGRLFLAGIALFCGSLYLLVLSNQRWLGMITPVGGVCFLAGWVLLAYACWQGLKTP